MTAVSYRLDVDGAPVDPAILGRLRRVEVEEHAGMADVLRLTFGLSVRADASGWDVLDDDVFTRLARVRLFVSVGSNSSQPLIEGYVVDVKADFTNEPEGSRLSVVAFDATVLMHLEEKVRAWPGMADSDIASAIFAEYGFGPEVEATQPARQENVMTVVQRGSDMQFLRMLAQRNGYECYVDLDPAGGQTVGHFHPARYADPPQGVLSIGLGQATNITRLQVHHDMLRPAATSANNVDVDTRQDQPVEVTEMAATPLGSRSTLPGDRARKLVLDQTGLALTGELQAYAQAVTDRSALAIRADGELDTQAYQGILRAKRPVLVRGGGRGFSGSYYVERVLHTFEGSDYRQQFTLRRNAVGLAGGEDFTAERA